MLELSLCSADTRERNIRKMSRSNPLNTLNWITVFQAKLLATLLFPTSQNPAFFVSSHRFIHLRDIIDIDSEPHLTPTATFGFTKKVEIVGPLHFHC